MARLPRPGADSGTWGTILNEYLSTSHAPDGVLLPNSVGSSQLQTGSVTNAAISTGAAIDKTKFAPAVQNSLAKADASLQVANNLSELSDASSARGNLGLGAMSTRSHVDIADLSPRAAAVVAGAVASSSAASNTLTAGTHRFTGTSWATWTLPLANTAEGMTIRVLNTGTAALTVVPSGADTIGSTSAPALLRPGDRVTLESNGSSLWVASYGTAVVMTDNFVQSYVTVVPGTLTINVKPFTIDGWSFIGAPCTLLPSGTWYVGVDLVCKTVRCLPRLGHRGWIPLARATTDTSTVTDIAQIMPKMPTSRLPRTMAKIASGQSLNVVVMGSSLTQGGNTTDWPGMLFNSSSSTNNYKVPATINATYAGVGASPNQYQLAQLGFASSHSSYGFPSSGIPGAVTAKTPPNGRSALFGGVDLVVVGCLANGGDYRLETIEPLIRKLLQVGVEVIMVTDNAQGPSSSYSSMINAGLYVDGPEVFRVAELYGVEVADTAAYVFEAHLRYGSGIYGDTIHMAGGAPTGRTANPSGGHEVWARAVRSVISYDGVTTAGAVISSDFASGVGSWYNYGNPVSYSVVSGALQVVANGTFQGVQIGIPGTISAGQSITVTFDFTQTSGMSVQVGMLIGSWSSGVSSPPSNGTHTFTITANSTGTHTLAFINFGSSGTFTLDNVTVTETTYSLVNLVPDRTLETRPLPPIRVVGDWKTPADTYIILPCDERAYKGSDPNRGTLGAHPWGAASFQRRWGVAAASNDLLTLTTGKVAWMGAHNVVGWAIIRYQDQNDAACTFTLSRNGTVVKTINLGTVPFGNEWFTSLYTPTELNNSGVNNDSLALTVTSGTLKIAALVALTVDQDFMFPQQITYCGAWLPYEDSRSGLPGYPTDTVGSYAVAKCTGRRMQWVISGNPGSMKWDAFSDREVVTDQNPGGNFHVYTTPALLGPGVMHTIRCGQSNASGSQANGHSLHIGGAIVINDR